jgi:hypothetical protein
VSRPLCKLLYLLLLATSFLVCNFASKGGSLLFDFSPVRGGPWVVFCLTQKYQTREELCAVKKRFIFQGPYLQRFIFSVIYEWAQQANYTRRERLAGDKHSSLLGPFVSYK